MTAVGFRPLTEDQYQRRVIDAARAHGWHVAHVRPARTTKGWRTPYEGDTGLPDLILARAGTVLLAEIKTDRGRTTFQPGQREWLAAAGVHGRLWIPAEWAEALAVLSRGSRWCLDAPCRFCAPDDDQGAADDDA